MSDARLAGGRAQLNTDGGSRGNPGESGIGFVVSVDNGASGPDGSGQPQIVCQGGAFIGVTTNNVAEYRALIWGLQNARALKVAQLEVLADSELMVKQLNGAYRVKNEGIKPLYRQAKGLMGGFERCVVRHVPRAQNVQADRLANEAMDSHGLVGDYCVAYEVGELFALEPTGEPAASQAPAAPAPAALPSTPQQKGPTMPDPSPTTTGTYALTVREHFDAAHALIGYPGQCKNLHGHTWDVDVTVRGTQLDTVGIVYDFKDLKQNLLSILNQFDHKYLNEVPPFTAMNSTAENLARVVFDQLEALLPPGISLVEVAVWESPIAKLTYTR